MDRKPDHYPRGINNYVPAMQFAADVGLDLECRFSVGTPAAADDDAIATAVDADGAVAKTAVASSMVADATYGRTVTAKASGATGGDTVLTIYGFDYLGQPLQKSITVTNANGTTAVDGAVAFKEVTHYACDGGAANAVTINLGWGAKLGVPYVTLEAVAEFEDNVKAGTDPTLTAPVFTDPATAATGDPRGLITPNGTLDGSAAFAFQCRVTNAVNASDNGGLHGIKHYGG